MSVNMLTIMEGSLLLSQSHNTLKPYLGSWCLKPKNILLTYYIFPIVFD